MYTTQAPAKVNLDLRIVATRDDGYHELDTVFQSVALADALTLTPWSGPFDITCITPGVPTDASNLAWKGAAAVAAALDQTLDGWRLHLEKHVPAEAGLGGGSADAVAAARLLLTAWDVSWDPGWLADVLAPVGADVPYFVHGGTMRGRGRGDRLERLSDVPSSAIVIVRPGFGVSTREAYRWYDELPRTATVGTLDWPDDSAGWTQCWSGCRNDLQAAVCRRHPAIGEAIDRLRRAGAALALMSGSGSAVVGLFQDTDVARSVAREWLAGYDVRLTHTVGTLPYRELTAVRRID